MSYNPRHDDDDAAGADDLAQISGIGSKTADRLYAAGITTYAELASRSADDIVTAVRGVAHPSAEQLGSWRDQARELADAAPATPARGVGEIPEERPGDGQREEGFMVRVLVNEDGSIRRTTVRNVGTGAERHWRGMEREALLDFIRSEISAPAPAAVPPPRAGSQPAAAPAAPAEERPPRHASSAVLSVERTALRAARPFTMTMTIDLAEPATRADRLAYSAIVVARPMAGGPKQMVARSDGLLATTSPRISIDAAGLPPGTYRIDAAVSLREPGGDHPVDLAAMTEGLLVQVLPG